MNLATGIIALTILFSFWARPDGLTAKAPLPSFVQRYDSRLLGALVALIGVVSILPYLQLQLLGLGIIVKTASGGQIPSSWAMVACFVLTCIFVHTSGIRGTAWIAVPKDIMMIVAVVGGQRRAGAGRSRGSARSRLPDGSSITAGCTATSRS
ncbi:MAG: hypothetical protein ACE15E_22065 [Acidobacteriota bacterium]